MTPTVRQRIEAQGTGFVGREPELALLRLALAQDGPLVVYVHGIGGVGKSALLEAFAAEARDQGAIVLILDGGAIEPTTRGFLEALSVATGSALETTEGAVGRLTSLGPSVIVGLDRYEALRALDTWFQRSFVPALGDGVRVVLCGREPPRTTWSLAMGRLFRSLPLGNLPLHDAETLLRQNGVAGADVERINRLARGHPLSLRLAASALIAGGTLDPDATTMTAIVEELTTLYLEHLDPPTRVALDAASVVRRPTLPLLAAMLPDVAPQDAFDRLRRLPFVELGTDGLALHDTIREVVAAFLRATDPDRSRRYRIAAWKLLRNEVARASPSEIRRYGADLLYLLENPAIREAWFPTTTQRYVVDAARSDEWPAILRISERQFPGESLALVEAWWRFLPEAFRMARDSAGEPAGFCAIGELGRIPRRLFEVDPSARTWRDHHRSMPVPRGQPVTVHRFQRADPQDPAYVEVVAALDMEVPRTWMELRPGPRRHYGSSRYWGGDLAEMDSRLGYELIPGTPRTEDGVVRYPFFVDFGPTSVDGWLTRIIATELRVEEDSILDVAQHQLVLGSRRVDLTTLEFAVFRYLYERPGTVVERSALLRDVWGYDDAGGSNVIDALVKALRQKLGDRAAAIETVRGLGYRFVASA